MTTYLDREQLDEQNEILVVRNIRLDINQKLMADGKVPDDKETLSMLMENLRDIDKSALTRARIKSDEKNAQIGANAEAISLVTNVLHALRGNKELPPEQVSDVVQAASQAPVLPETLEKKDFVDGQLHIGTINEDIDAFKKRLGL